MVLLGTAGCCFYAYSLTMAATIAIFVVLVFAIADSLRLAARFLKSDFSRILPV